MTTFKGGHTPSGPEADPDLPLTDANLIDEDLVTADDGDDDPTPLASTRTISLGAASIGLSFRVQGDVDLLAVRCRWGVYERAASEMGQETKTGQAARVWRRHQVDVTTEIDLTAADPVASPSAEQPEVHLVWVMKEDGHARTVTLSLVNEQATPLTNPDTAKLFQVEVEVTALDGSAAVFAGHNDPYLGKQAHASSDSERRHLELLFRNTRDYAHGQQCAVDAEVRPGESRAWRLRTTCFPSADVAQTVPTDVPGLVTDMRTLGALEPRELAGALRPLVDGYRRWIDDTEAAGVDDVEVVPFKDVFDSHVSQARAVADRLERAIDLLRADPDAQKAFAFANQAMARQRVRGQLARARKADPMKSAAQLLVGLDVPRNRSWRPFQLAFVLLCLPGLTDPTHQDAHRTGSQAEVELLFFPTGGGKTEAYLGLTAYTLAIRRLQAAHDPSAADGIAVLMRYTLRLLTAQQFQRAAALICACEVIRRTSTATWGKVSFRVGLWVGGSVTPNRLADAKEQLQRDTGSYEALGGPRQLADCPWCGAALSNNDLKIDGGLGRLLLGCPDETCAFNFAKNAEGLPVLVTDEEIYRLTPSLLIGTVDKFAQLTWFERTAPLFGLVRQECERHGWVVTPSECTGKAHPATPSLKKSLIVPADNLRPPDLIIQDELHLISDALGSMVGLYETAVDHLCTRDRARPMVVASTATVRRAREQVRAVFDRELTIFPPQVLNAGETFFSTPAPVDDDHPGRRYRGILATGERLKAIEVRVASSLLVHGQELLDRYGEAADPYLTLVDYFTSTRELAGMRRLVEDDIQMRVGSLENRQAGVNRGRIVLKELTSRMPSSQITQALADVERTFSRQLDGSVAKQPVAQGGRTRNPDDKHVRPVDVLLATSMLQVGVDVPRLGLMVVTGQPKNTAEYIQATSRVGRDPSRPGLVLTLFHWSRPRDLAHMERFGYDHATFGMRVEGLTTTPFSDRALDKGLSAALVAAYRHAGADTMANEGARLVSSENDLLDGLADLFAARAGRATESESRKDEVRKQVMYRVHQWKQRRQAFPSLTFGKATDSVPLLSLPDGTPWKDFTAPMSLRNVEDEINLQIHHDPGAPLPGWSRSSDA